MPTSHTRINLDDVEDAAPQNGFDDRWEARVARTGARRRADRGHSFPAAGRQAVSVLPPSYARGGDLRVAPEVARAFEAGPDGLELLAFGPHLGGDGELVDDPWIT